MRLLHLEPPVVMNIKKIRRLMKKYGLFCPIRQANPYRRMARAMQTSHVAKNEIQRQFKAYAPRKALLTDITYLFYRGGVCYLSPILDVCTHEVLAYQLSNNLRVDFVLDMVDDMCARYGAELDNTTIYAHALKRRDADSAAAMQTILDLADAPADDAGTDD